MGLFLDAIYARRQTKAYQVNQSVVAMAHKTTTSLLTSRDRDEFSENRLIGDHARPHLGHRNSLN